MAPALALRMLGSAATFVAILESHFASHTPFSRMHLARPGWIGTRLDRRFHAAPLEALHVLGDLREGRIDLGQFGGVASR